MDGDQFFFAERRTSKENNRKTKALLEHDDSGITRRFSSKSPTRSRIPLPHTSEWSRLPKTASLSSTTNLSLDTLLSFLNSHSRETWAREDILWLLRVPSLSDALNRVIILALQNDDCVLGVDELAAYVVSRRQLTLDLRV